MNINLDHIKAVVTGASTGIGLAMTHALLLHGATVALSARPSEKLNRVVDELNEKGLKAFALPMDVRDENMIEEAVGWVADNWGRIDLLVNNAGLMMHRVNPDFFSSPEPFFKLSPNEFRDAIDTNLTGYFLVSRGFVPLMIDKGEGRIVNISTSLSTMTRKGFAPYGPSRAGSEALSKVMTADLEEFGIMVNVLLPGGAVNKGIYASDTEDFSKFPIQLLDIEIMIDPILFLASPLANGMTGERIIAKEFHAWLKEKGIVLPA